MSYEKDITRALKTLHDDLAPLFDGPPEVVVTISGPMVAIYAVNPMDRDKLRDVELGKSSIGSWYRGLRLVAHFSWGSTV